jgi:carbamoyltransferase
LFQGRAEGGPRALGNRSILFDPRRQDGKDFVNRVKRREWFRPFAGSVMEEHANEWFDMAGMQSSPFMMYAVDVRNDKIAQIPAVTHVDNTCRVQTVNPEQNAHYYELIQEFHKLTGVPLLFNTSFNLAGQPLVETMIDALVTLFNSDIEYLYMPDIGKLVKKNK